MSHGKEHTTDTVGAGIQMFKQMNLFQIAYRGGI